MRILTKPTYKNKMTTANSHQINERVHQLQKELAALGCSSFFCVVTPKDETLNKEGRILTGFHVSDKFHDMSDEDESKAIRGACNGIIAGFAPWFRDHAPIKGARMMVPLSTAAGFMHEIESLEKEIQDIDPEVLKKYKEKQSTAPVPALTAPDGPTLGSSKG